MAYMNVENEIVCINIPSIYPYYDCCFKDLIYKNSKTEHTLSQNKVLDIEYSSYFDFLNNMIKYSYKMNINQDNLDCVLNFLNPYSITSTKKDTKKFHENLLKNKEEATIKSFSKNNFNRFKTPDSNYIPNVNIEIPEVETIFEKQNDEICLSSDYRLSDNLKLESCCYLCLLNVNVSKLFYTDYNDDLYFINNMRYMSYTRYVNTIPDVKYKQYDFYVEVGELDLETSESKTILIGYGSKYLLYFEFMDNSIEDDVKRNIFNFLFLNKKYCNNIKQEYNTFSFNTFITSLEMVILKDLITQDDAFYKYYILKESFDMTKNIQMFFAGREFNISKSDSEYLLIKTTGKSVSTAKQKESINASDDVKIPTKYGITGLELIYFNYQFKKLTDAIYAQMSDLKQIYINGINYDFSRVGKKTKRNLDELKMAEPNMFITSDYSKICQFNHQPYIFNKNTDELKFLPRGIESDLDFIKRFDKNKIFEDKDNLLLKFPQNEETLKEFNIKESRIYACVPRNITFPKFSLITNKDAKVFEENFV